MSTTNQATAAIRESILAFSTTGFQHIPVGPLTPQMEQLAMLASVSDGKVADSKHGDSPEAGAASSSSATSAGGQVSGRTGHQVKAFSGKGRTLSSSGAQPTGGSGQLTGGSRVSQADPIRQTARLIAQRTLSTLRETESRLQQQVRTMLLSSFWILCANRFEL